MDVPNLIGSLGLPVGLLVVLVMGGWRVLVWIAPRIDRLISGHLAFLDKLDQSLARMEQLLTRGTKS